ncbi:MAG: MFS transporter [Pseudomonadota bacterium]
MASIRDDDGPPPQRWRSLALLVVAELTAMALWFLTAAVLPELAAEAALSPARQAWLSSAVQAGFVVGALTIAATGLADRLDPRHVVAASASAAAVATAMLLVVPVGGVTAVALRGLTGFCLAGVYPVGMKIVAGWGVADRGFLVGLLVGALTVGSAMPHLLAFAGGAAWRPVVGGAALMAALGGLAVLWTALGPYHARAPRFDAGAIHLAWQDRRIRAAYGGYLGHMWELYAMWAWLAAALTVSFGARLADADALAAARMVTFLAIALGGIACIVMGRVADRIGKAEVAIGAMALSGSAALLTAWSFGGPVWLTAALAILWGVAIVPDSAQFSALVADAAPPEKAGSLLTFQTALGFALTTATVQVAPLVATAVGWPLLLASLALGPAVGILAMRPLLRKR